VELEKTKGLNEKKKLAGVGVIFIFNRMVKNSNKIF